MAIEDSSHIQTFAFPGPLNHHLLATYLLQNLLAPTTDRPAVATGRQRDSQIDHAHWKNDDHKLGMSAAGLWRLHYRRSEGVQVETCHVNALEGHARCCQGNMSIDNACEGHQHQRRLQIQFPALALWDSITLSDLHPESASLLRSHLVLAHQHGLRGA